MQENYARQLLAKTKKDYNLIAKEFSNTRQNPWPETKFLFDKYLNPLDKVLDLGCGNGRFYPFFKNVNYLGIDYSKELIKCAREKFPQAEFQVADALNLPFKDNSFDKVFSIAVFHHIPSRALRLKFLKEAKRVLRPNGFFVLLVWKLPFRKEKFFLIKFTILKLLKLTKLDFRDVLEPWGKKLLRYYHLFNQKELRNLAKEVGFVIADLGLVRNSRGNRKNFYLVLKKPSSFNG